MATDQRVPRDPSKIVDPLSVIEHLEKKQGRAVREAMLTGDSTRLKEIEDDIVWLRSIAKW